MKKYFLLLIPFLLFGRAYEPNKLCEEVELVSKEAKMIYTHFKDPTNALNLLNAGAFGSITYRKPDCMSEKKYLQYLDAHVLYMSESKYNHSFGSIENYIKKYPQHLYFKLKLGKSYENKYVKDKRQEYREKALKVYKTYIKQAKIQNVEVDKNILAFVKSGGLVKAKSTWAQHLNPSGDAPMGAFKAIYIDTHNPKVIVASEKVKDIGVNYPYDQFHNIKSSNFGGYWVGLVKYEKETTKMIYVSQSNATTRVIIDGYVVYDGNNRGGVTHTFKKGVHKIEVEHINSWHTTELSVKIIDKIEKYDINEIHNKLSSLVSKSTNFLYVGVYESKKKDSSIILKIQKSKVPVVLMLQSYRAVIWEIENLEKTKIQAIIINSSSPEATLRGDTKGIKVFYSKQRVGNGYNSGLADKRSENCNCISGHYSCGSNVGFSANKIPLEFSKKVRGFSGSYASSVLSVPELIMSDEKYQEIQKHKEQISKMRAECLKNNKLSPNELFK